MNENINLDLFVNVLAHVTLAQTTEDPNLMKIWRQSTWGRVTMPIPAEAEETISRVRAADGYVTHNEIIAALGPDYEQETRVDGQLPKGATSCGTAFCVAGWADVLSGKSLNWAVSEYNGVLTWELASVDVGADLVSPGNEQSIIDAAMEALGIVHHAYNNHLFAGGMPRLFVASNTIDDVMALSAEHIDITRGELEVLVNERVAVLKAEDLVRKRFAAAQPH